MKTNKITAGIATLATALVLGSSANAGDCCVTEGTSRVHTKLVPSTVYVPHTVYHERTTVVTPRTARLKVPCLGDELLNGIADAGQALFGLFRVPSREDFRFSVPLPPRVRTSTGCYDSCDPVPTCDPCETSYRNHTIAPAPNLAPTLSPGPAVNPNDSLYSTEPTR